MAMEFGFSLTTGTLVNSIRSWFATFRLKGPRLDASAMRQAETGGRANTFSGMRNNSHVPSKITRQTGWFTVR
jgi:hypothetical protein